MRWTLALLGLMAPLLLVPDATGADAPTQDVGPMTLQGESPAATNIPTRSDRRAAEGAYLALDTVRRAPAGGWYARYEIEAPAAGVYRLDAVLTTPAMPDRQPFGGSQFNLAVNGSRYAQVVKSEPDWASWDAAPPAWGSLVDTTVDDVELRRGTNTITFMVDERRISASPQLDQPRRKPTPPRYRFYLDELTLTRTRLALDGIHLGNPDVNLGTFRSGQAWLHFGLNGHTSAPRSIRYRIVDYFGDHVDTGTAVVPDGASGVSVRITGDQPPGNYRVTGWLTARPKATVVGNFARLPEQVPVRGAANRFAVTTSVPWLVPSSRLNAFAAALHEMGAGYVREEISWPLVEPRRGVYDTRALDRIARVFRKHDIEVLGALWNLAAPGEAQAPRWAMSPASKPLPADLRDAYRLGQHLAGRTDGIGRDAIELWNEPDVDIVRLTFSRQSGDQYAAFVKAAALGVADSPTRPWISLPGIAFPGTFQHVMLQNDVARYVDVWAFHGYGGSNPFGSTELSVAPWFENQLRWIYRAKVRMWMTEAGTFIEPKSAEHGLTLEQQTAQARYLVKSTVDDLASGTDKHFWFAAAPYGGFGLLNHEFQPWPSYSAYAGLTSILGEADFASRVGNLPDGVQGYRFDSGSGTVTVVWSDRPRPVAIETPADDVEIYNIMGERVRVASTAGGGVTVQARRDPIYLASEGAGLPTAAPPVGGSQAELSEAEHIVLSQQFAAAARPEPPPFGYRLKRHTRMSVTVYNFNDIAKTVTLRPRAYGGWAIRSRSDRTVTVPAGGQVRVPFMITAGDRVERRIDYPLVFDAASDDRRVPPSVSLIQLGRSGPPGDRIRLRPSITDISPAAGSTIMGPRVRLTARITDRLSGVDPRTVLIQVDGRHVSSTYDPRTDRVSAALQLSPGRHEVWIGAYNNAHAPSRVVVTLNVRR
jgi:hypothetical protein